MLTSKCAKCGVYIFIVVLLVDTVTSQNPYHVKRSSTTRQATKRYDGYNRTRRAPFISSYATYSHQGINHYQKQPGFFWLLKNLFVEQIQDTKNTYNQIRGFVNQDQPSSTTESHEHDENSTSEPTTTTTMMPRQELRKVLLRNLRGIINLYNKELEIALRQSEFTRNDFNKQLKYSIAEQLH